MVMMMDRLRLFHKALDACVKLQGQYPEDETIDSIIKQIQYLISLETGQNRDRSRLKDIVIGIQAAREIEPLDLGIAQLLYAVDIEAGRM